MNDCAACGAAWVEDAYDHAGDCRIGLAAKRVRDRNIMRDMIEASSLGTPGAKALRKLGGLVLNGMTDDEALAELTPYERAVLEDELASLTRSWWTR